MTPTMLEVIIIAIASLWFLIDRRFVTWNTSSRKDELNKAKSRFLQLIFWTGLGALMTYKLSFVILLLVIFMRGYYLYTVIFDNGYIIIVNSKTVIRCTSRNFEETLEELRGNNIEFIKMGTKYISDSDALNKYT